MKKDIIKISRDIKRLNRTVKMSAFVTAAGKALVALMLVLTAADAFLSVKKA